MLFSVLIPVYNVEKYLDECLMSILGQKEKSIEIILVDDGSLDSSGSICDDYAQKYPNMIKVIHKENEGLLMARRDALADANGDYILFCDSDDYYMPNAFQILKNIIERYNPDLVLYNLVLSCEGKITGKLNKKDLFEKETLFSDKRILYSHLLTADWNANSMAAKCMKRSCACAGIDYSEYKGLDYGEDLLQSIRIYSTAEKIVYTNKDIYCYRQGTGMMGRYAPGFYSDFMKIYYVFDQYREEWNLEEFEQKKARYCLYIAYFSVQRLKEVDRLPEEINDYFSRIAESEEFRNSFKSLGVIRIVRLFSWKRIFILFLLYGKCYQLLCLLIKCIRRKGRKYA